MDSSQAQSQVDEVSGQDHSSLEDVSAQANYTAKKVTEEMAGSVLTPIEINGRKYVEASADPCRSDVITVNGVRYVAHLNPTCKHQDGWNEFGTIYGPAVKTACSVGYAQGNADKWGASPGRSTHEKLCRQFEYQAKLTQFQNFPIPRSPDPGVRRPRLCSLLRSSVHIGGISRPQSHAARGDRGWFLLDQTSRGGCQSIRATTYVPVPRWLGLRHCTERCAMCWRRRRVVQLLGQPETHGALRQCLSI